MAVTQETLFSNAELKAIALEAIGNTVNPVPSVVKTIISNSEEIIDRRVEEKITEKTNDLMNQINNVGSEVGNLSNSANIPISIPTNVGNTIPNPENIISSLSTTRSFGSIPSTPSVPEIPSVPSVSSAIPGGLSLDPTQYIPDVQIPFKAFIKPLLDKAISSALGKINPASLVQQVEGKLGKLQSKSISGLQNLQKSIDNGLAAASDTLQNNLQQQIDSSSDRLGSYAKLAARESQEAKKRVADYIKLTFLKRTNPQAFLLDPGVSDYNKINNA